MDVTEQITPQSTLIDWDSMSCKLLGADRRDGPSCCIYCWRSRRGDKGEERRSERVCAVHTIIDHSTQNKKTKQKAGDPVPCTLRTRYPKKQNVKTRAYYVHAVELVY